MALEVLEMAIKLGFKFLYNALLINLIIIIITQPLGTILSNNWKHVSKVATVILYVAQVIIVVLRLILYLFL